MALESFQIPLGRLLDSDPVAVIDIGSNSVRLIIYEGLRRSPAVLFNEKVLCGLGRSVASTGKLNKESIEKTLSTLKRFRAISEQLGVGKIRAIATAAARDAKNGSDFIEQAEKILGFKIHILTGEKEAEIAAKGVISGIYDADGFAVDMGGGSLEIIDIQKQKLSGGVTLPLGGLRLMDVCENDRERASLFTAQELAKVSWLERGRGRPLYAVGGTLRAIAKLHMAQENYPLRVVHGYKISPDDVVQFSKLLHHLTEPSLAKIHDIAKARRDTVPFGAIVFENLVRVINPSEIVFSSYGVREGVLYDLLGKKEQEKDPLLAACNDLCVISSRSPQNSYELGIWTDQLFDGAKLKENAREKRLRHAACLLSDVAWRTHPEYRADHSLNMIAHGTFPGVDHAERAFLAMAVYFRHEGRVKNGKMPHLAKLMDEQMLKRAQIIGVSIRVAHMVAASMPGVLGKISVEFKDKKVILNLPKPYHILEGERLVRRFSHLAELLECEPDICVGGKSRFLEFIKS